MNHKNCTEIIARINEDSRLHSKSKVILSNIKNFPYNEYKICLIGKLYSFFYLKKIYSDCQINFSICNTIDCYINVLKNNRIIRIKVRTVSLYSKKRIIPSIHYNKNEKWDKLFLLCLDKSYSPIGFWIHEDIKIFKIKNKISGLRMKDPQNANSGSRILNFSNDKLDYLLKILKNTNLNKNKKNILIRSERGIKKFFNIFRNGLYINTLFFAITLLIAIHLSNKTDLLINEIGKKILLDNKKILALNLKANRIVIDNFNKSLNYIKKESKFSNHKKNKIINKLNKIINNSRYIEKNTFKMKTTKDNKIIEKYNEDIEKFILLAEKTIKERNSTKKMMIKNKDSSKKAKDLYLEKYSRMLSKVEQSSNTIRILSDKAIKKIMKDVKQL